MELIRRIFVPPASSFFLFGPRGTGKSTWLRQNMPDAFFIDLLNPEEYRAYLSAPERLRQVVDAQPKVRQVVIDEVQKAPQLLDVVHGLIEHAPKRALQFVLTGSSSRKLKRAGVDLLAGRVLMRTLHPFMAAELGERFDLARALRLGMLPLVLGSSDPEETLRSYVSLYLREEVQAEGLIRNVGDFARFVEAISLSHGALLNTSEVARECQVNRKTADGFVQILEDLLLGFRLPVFTRRAKRRLVQHPKFYYMDAGVYRSLRPRGPLDLPEMIGGACLEGLVAQHLRAWIAYSRGEHSLYFWRTQAGLEVDFVLYGDSTFLALEVKSGRTASESDTRALRAFLEDYPQARACLLYGGRQRLQIGPVLCLPCQEFLASLRPDQPPAAE